MTSSTESPVIAITSGDPNGIGPEIALKTITHIDLHASTPLLVGPESLFSFYLDTMEEKLSWNKVSSVANIKPNQLNILDQENQRTAPHPGQLEADAGKQAMRSVELAADLCIEEQVHAMVTAPISKEAVNKAGYSIPGHTEFLAERTGTTDFMMMLIHEELRVALSTIHVPVKDIAALITEENLVRQLGILNRTLKTDFNIKKPRIAVLGLNPHAGDGGYIGREELDIIAPALQKARLQEIQVEGAFPADGFFGKRSYVDYDAVLAMYHDQGLVAFKTISFGKGVNFTAGLPIVRTSPDHGTAFDIAGQNMANAASMIQAYEVAVSLAKNRSRQQVAHD